MSVVRSRLRARKCDVKAPPAITLPRRSLRLKIVYRGGSFVATLVPTTGTFSHVAFVTSPRARVIYAAWPSFWIGDTCFDLKNSEVDKVTAFLDAARSAS